MAFSAPEAAASPFQATRVAQNEARQAAFPSSQTNSFEGLSFGASTSSSGTPIVTYGPWRLDGAVGIAVNGANILGGLTAPNGTTVAHITGLGELYANKYLNAGLYRVRYQCAQQSGLGVPDEQVLGVYLDGVLLAEHEPGAQFGEYVTRTIELTAGGSRQLRFSGRSSDLAEDTAFIDQVFIEPVADWNDTHTWQGAAIPTVNEDVIIPAGVVVALRNTCMARTTTVEGELTTANADATLDTHWVKVDGNASSFHVGTEAVPYLEDFTLTLLTVTSGAQIPIAANNFKALLAMNGGQLELHGAPRVSWTKLAATPPFTSPPAGPGPTITLVDAVDWEKGDQIVLAGSAYQRVQPGFAYVDQAETAGITDVSGGGTQLTLDTPLEFLHHGGVPKTYTSENQSWALDERAEVGLLTHNIKVQGDLASETNSFGGHIMVMGLGTSYNNVGVAHISGVELTRMGQRGELARYPMHWHTLRGDADGQYIRDSSIHNTYNRAVTIHGTDGVFVERNVAYDNLGHAIFLENGGERFNHINYNFALSTRRPDPAVALLTSDFEGDSFQNRSPATYWIANPNNEMIGNVAGGTIGTGFWFAFPRYVTGPGSGDPHFAGINAQSEPLGSFVDNVCHNSRNAFDVNDSFDDVDDLIKNISWNPPTTAYLDNFVQYSCHTGIYAGTGSGDVVYRNNVIADCKRGVTLAAYHSVLDTLILADSFNGLINIPEGPESNIAYALYDGAGFVERCSMQGYDVPGSSLLLNIGGADKHNNSTFSTVDFGPSGSPLPRIILPDYASAPSSCGGAPGDGNPRRWGLTLWTDDDLPALLSSRTLVGNHPWMARIAPAAKLTGTYPVDTQWPNSPTDRVYISTSRFGHLKIRHRLSSGAFVAPSTAYPLTFTRDDHAKWMAATFLNCYDIDVHHQIPIVVNEDYEYGVAWNNQLPPGVTKLRVHLGDLFTGEYGTLRLENMASSQSLVVELDQGPSFNYGTLAALRQGSVSGHAVVNNDLWLRFVVPPAMTSVTFELRGL